jgi:hypothetical protein
MAAFLVNSSDVLSVWSKINILQYYSHTGIHQPAILWEVFHDFPEMNTSKK